MLLSRLASTSTALAATRSRIAKRELIAAVLTDATAEDVEMVVAYLSGSLRQRRTGLGWKSMEMLPDPAAESTLTVQAVDATFAEIAGLAGAGSAAARSQAVSRLFALATAEEQVLLRGLVSGELRQGALEAQVQEGLAQAYDVPLSSVRRAAMLMSSTTAAATSLIEGGQQALDAVGLQVGTAVQPMLAASAADADAAIAKSGLPALVDFKLDGIRVQVHQDGSDVRVFTRSLEDITDRLPEVVTAVSALGRDRLVLDGEVLALRPDRRPEPFQVTASRTASRTDVDAQAMRTPLTVAFFDLLHLDGADLLDERLTDRMEQMRRLLPAELIVARFVCETTEQVTAVFDDAVTSGYEGVVVKDPASTYAAGRRDSSWIKIKPRHTLDLVVTAVEWGSGRRQGWLSNLHLAARDAETGQPIMLGKTFKGLTDELLTWQTAHFLALETRRTRATVFVEPTTVVEIACDGLQSSTRYPGGVALRFARVLGYRTDKTAAESDTLGDVLRLLPAEH